MHCNNIMDCIDMLDYYVENINIGRAIIIVDSTEEAKIVMSVMSERDYPCGLQLDKSSRFIILTVGQLLFVENITMDPINMINAIFILDRDGLDEVVNKLRHVLDTRLETYIIII